MGKMKFFIPLFLMFGVILSIPKTSKLAEYEPIIFQQNGAEPSTKAFDVMMDVLTHERCMNCHPNDNIPKQGSDSHPHYFGMERGENDLGFQATKCTTCHQDENNGYSGVPGAPHWSLAPASMGWQGLSRTEIAERMLSEKTNGGRSHSELIEHMTEDKLVLWAWKPGVNAEGKQRELPPVSEENFKIAVKQWFENGAVIPQN